MSRAFDPKYTDAQRQAVIADALASGNVAETVRKAARGELAGVPAFEINYQYASQLVRQEKAGRNAEKYAAKANGTPAEHREAMVRRGYAIVNRQLTILERQEQRAKGRVLSPDQIERGRKLYAWGREVLAFERGMAPTRGGTAQERRRQADRAAREGEAPSREAALVAQMQKDLAQQAREEPHPTTPDPQDRGTDWTAPGTDRTETDQGEDGEGGTL